MSTLDEITKEKQRLGEALARVDAQREKLSSQLSELEATERVLARYSRGRPGRRTASAKMPATEGQATAPARRRGRQRAATGRPPGKPSSSTLGDQVLALATGKTQQEIAAACKGARPKPRRRRPCPTQTGWPHRRARREALRQTVDGDRASRRGLTPGQKIVSREGPGMGD